MNKNASYNIIADSFEHLHDIRPVRQPQKYSAAIVKSYPRSWAIAFFEYCLMVPANRPGFANGFSGFQLKIVQDVIPATSSTSLA